YSGTVTRVVGDQIEIAALTSTDATGDAAQRARYPQSLRSGGSHATAIRNRMPFNIADTQTDPSLPEPVRAFARVRGYRGLVVVPLLRQNEVLGGISVTRREAGGFSDKQVELLKTFADQAVIAIENVRLFTELQASNRDLSETLEQQTATSEVLKVISRSAFDVQPVFDVVAENAVTLCEANKAFIYRFDGEYLRIAATYNVSPETRDFVERNPHAPGRYSAAARAALERRTSHITDVHADPEYTYGGRDVDPYRTIVAVPMLKGDELVGVITIYRWEVKPFTDKQIALVETFADQAVIAIENVRLFNELQTSNRELTNALDTQTATSDILGVISR